jgi:transposase
MHGARCVRGSEGTRHHSCPALKKTLCGGCGRAHRGWYDRRTRRTRDLSCGDARIYLEFEVRRVRCKSCGTVKRERLKFLADNPFYTKRFAHYVGRRCRSSSIKDIAQELNLDWDTVKALEKQYMAAQLAKAGTPGPKAIGIDEISIRKGHTYRIVVSDLIRERPIWFGGEDRSEKSMAMFYDWLGEKKTTGIRLAVMDMWKPFRNVTSERAPRAAILFDKFHIMRHLGKALDEVRKSEYRRLSGRDRSYIKGQKYTLLSRRENLTLDGRKALKKLLAANNRLNRAYLLKESFGQLWDYDTEGWARRFFENWRASLKWQRLAPYEKFAEMIERHWDGIAAYCKPENKVSLGFVEGLNNKIRVIQRRAYGLRDQEYLRLKILTCMLPAL